MPGTDALSRLQAAGQHALEVTPGEAVLFLVEERPRQLQTYPCKLRAYGEHGVQGGNGLIKQRLALRLLGPEARRLDRGQPEQEHRVRIDLIRGRERAQQRQRLVEPARIEQRPGLGHHRVRRWRFFRRHRRWGLLLRHRHRRRAED